ncbi:hypothetical protein REC12_20470 [Desulfosporosinus sp. PR]|uniref:hypothetical protein n=1 Tax=Candidatus Desulfosporosinus nitrosoreducens TaxID=3401928 RepID=UPI0027E6B4E1|nr:hypothetical protein [Desulfosporosinus sp. PR]MDQ7095973.1 hypothetical protein [Desulfosporosinus sp. PR]
MSNELAVNNQEVEIMPGFMSLKSFEFTQRAATLLANSSLVPKEYQNNIPNCVIALNMASRMGADPLMVMQNLYIVYGRPGWSSQFLISTFNTSGRFSALRYEWIGQKGTDQYGCKAWAIEKATGEKLEGSTVTIDIAKKEGWYTKNGSKWQTMSDQMLMYRAASWFIRAYAPEMAMGMHTTEEIIDIGGNDPEFEISRKANRGPVVDVKPESEPEIMTSQNIESSREPEPEINTSPAGPDF